MAITSIREFKGTTGSHNLKNERRYSRQFLAISDNVTDGPVTTEAAFYSATTIRRGSHYQTPTEYDLYSYVQEIKFARDAEDGLQWIISVEYGPAEERETNPLAQKAKIKVGGQVYEEITDFDIWQKAIINSAGDPYADPITRDRTIPIITVDQVEQYYDLATALFYADTVNASTFLGFGPRYLKCNFPSGDSFDYNGVTLWNVHYEFVFNPRRWDKIVVSKGFREYDTSLQKHKVIVDDYGNPLSSPGLLNQNGGYIRPIPGVVPQPYYQTFQVYYPVPWPFSFRF